MPDIYGFMILFTNLIFFGTVARQQLWKKLNLYIEMHATNWYPAYRCFSHRYETTSWIMSTFSRHSMTPLKSASWQRQEQMPTAPIPSTATTESTASWIHQYMSGIRKAQPKRVYPPATAPIPSTAATEATARSSKTWFLRCRFQHLRWKNLRLLFKIYANTNDCIFPLYHNCRKTTACVMTCVSSVYYFFRDALALLLWWRGWTILWMENPVESNIMIALPL